MKKITYIFLFGALFLLSSCEDFFEQTVTIDVPEHEPKLGITAIWNQDQDSLAVMVSKSVGALSDDQSSILNGASVKLFEGENLISDFREKETSGIYYTEGIHFKENQTYKLEVSAPNMNTVTATQEMPSAPEILESHFFVKKGKLSIRFKDKPTEDVYSVELQKVKNFGGSIYLDPNGISQESAMDGYDKSIFLDDTFNGKETTQSFFSSYHNVIKGDTLNLYLTKVTKEYYFFDQAYLKQVNSLGPFSEPIILPSNFENGFGLFALRNQTQFEVIAEE